MNESKMFAGHAAAVAAYESKVSGEESTLRAPVGSRIWFKDKYNGNEFVGTVIEHTNHEDYWWYKVRVDKVLNNRYLDENVVGVVISADENEVLEYDN